MQSRQEKLQLAKEAAEGDLLTFIRLVAPHRMLGSIHEELIHWWYRGEAKDEQLTLLPRAHQKSMLMAYRVAWEITRNPAVTILYISATSTLAEKQLKAIKDILTCPIYRRYWGDMVFPDEGRREKWTSTEICVDHPKRFDEGIRDSTVFAAGLTTTITGLHCDIAVLDDVVVKENAYTEDGRRKVAEQYSLLSSIENPGAREWVVGTRYHPKDLYQDLLEMEEEIYDESGELVDRQNIYEVFERQVEDRGDGTGEFIWPRQRRNDGKYFGFDTKELARKRGKYLDKTQFRAQYYNDPNDPEGARVSPDKFQYYDKQFLSQQGGNWYYKENKLNVVASIDFAFSLRKSADYTAIVVVGMDGEGNYYILGIDRFRSDKIIDYFRRILAMHKVWGFRKLRAEVTVAQQAIVRELKESYIKEYGLSLSIDEYRPSRHEGTKEERIAAILEPRYDNQSIWHYKGGYCQTLEEELVMAHPPHDDIKDCLASAIDICVPPSIHRKFNKRREDNVIFDSRFGGVRF